MTDKFLVIDDLRSFKPGILESWSVPVPEVTYARTSRNGLTLLQDAEPNEYVIVHLDHDLGAGSDADGFGGAYDTIMPCPDYITENAEKFKETAFYVHTSNPYAGDAMMKQLGTEGLFAVRVPASDFFIFTY